MQDLFAPTVQSPLIDQDYLAEFAAEQGWKVRTDANAMAVHEIIYTKACEYNSQYEVQIWTGVHRSSAPRPGKHPFRIFGYNKRLGQNRTNEMIVFHSENWQVNVPNMIQHVEDMMRSRWNNKQRKMPSAGYVVTEFGHQVNY